MIAADTNILVRIVTNDDTVQARLAARTLRREAVFVPKTVLLEMAWVLRYAYKLERTAIVKAVRGILGLANVEAEDPIQVARALDWYEQGLDFADAIHLASSGEAGLFITFDEQLIKKTRRLHGTRAARPR
jgi:predicted nucleic-acid-binding protein